MAQINTFVHEAREKGLSDEAIRKALEAQGWDRPLIDTALLGLEVPKAPEDTSPSHPMAAQQQSLSPLMAAMQHVLLWFFTASSTVTIASVVASLSGFNISAQVLASMIAVTLITFTPYAVIFLLYVVRLRRAPGLVPSKVWSIITICLHSVAAMAAGITLVVTLIVSGEYSIWLSALLILALDIIVVVTYVFAAFSLKLRRARKIAVLAHLPVLLLLFGTLFVMSLLQLGPARHDEQLRKDMASSATAIRDYTVAHKALPTSGSGVLKSSEIRYKKVSDTTYSLCATFQASPRRGSYYYGYGNSPTSDAYAYEAQFQAYGSGEHCFTLISTELENQQNQRYY
jgi:hypothetical protein